MATLALVPPQAAPQYADAARVFLRVGIPSAALRLRAACEPEYAALFTGVAEAMDALAAPS